MDLHDPLKAPQILLLHLSREVKVRQKLRNVLRLSFVSDAEMAFKYINAQAGI